MDDPKLVRLMELVAENRSLKQSLEEMQMKWEVHMTLMMEDKGLTMDAKPLGYMGGVDDGSLSVDDKKGEETKHVHAAESEKSQSASASKNKHPACIGETSEVSSTDFKCDAVYPAALSESSKNEMTQSSTVDVDGKIFSLEAENEAMKIKLENHKTRWESVLELQIKEEEENKQILKKLENNFRKFMDGKMGETLSNTGAMFASMFKEENGAAEGSAPSTSVHEMLNDVSGNQPGYPPGFSCPTSYPVHVSEVSVLTKGFFRHKWQKEWWLLYSDRIDCFVRSDQAKAHVDYIKRLDASGELDVVKLNEQKDEKKIPPELPPPLLCIGLDVKGVKVSLENMEEYSVPFGLGFVLSLPTHTVYLSTDSIGETETWMKQLHRVIFDQLGEGPIDRQQELQ